MTRVIVRLWLAGSSMFGVFGSYPSIALSTCIPPGEQSVDWSSTSGEPGDRADRDGNRPQDVSGFNNRFVSDFPGLGVTWFVGQDGPPTGSCTSWADACPDLQTALALAEPGDEVWIAAGTYKPAGIGGDRNATFLLESGVEIYGGFAGDEDPAEFDLDDRDLLANETTLSGDLNGNDNPAGFPGGASYSDNCYHVLTSSGVTSSAVLDGVTVRGGRANGSGVPASSGGAMFNDGGDPTIRKCRVTENSATTFGGAIYNTNGADPNFTGCTFEGNHGDQAGGMFNESSSVIITDCIFADNITPTDGGAVSNHTTTAVITGCTFSGNSAPKGGAIKDFIANDTIKGCQFIDNTAITGGAMMAEGGSTLNLSDSRFIGNSATGSNGGAIAVEQSSMNLVRCDLIDNSAHPVSGSGGAVYYVAGAVAMTNCRLLGNSSGTSGGGGGIKDGTNGPGASATLVNCLLAGNVAGNAAGGAANVRNASFINCTIATNAAPVVGGIFHDAGSLTIRNGILWGNSESGSTSETAQLVSGGTASVQYTLLQGLDIFAGGTGNIDGDPLFVDANGTDNQIGTEDDNFRLPEESPCNDAGNNAVLPSDSGDLDGDLNLTEVVPVDLAEGPRFLNDPLTPNTGSGTAPIVDLGAYEFLRDCNQNQVADDYDLAGGLSQDCDASEIPDECELNTDSDSLIDACDPDDDNDGVGDQDDSAGLNPAACADADADGCDDCAIGVDGFGPLPDNLPGNDGLDTDADGSCDAGDPDDDNDGVDDQSDSDALNPDLCADADADGCDDCSIGVDGLGPLSDVNPLNDGPDADLDGVCDLSDNCPKHANQDQADCDEDGVGDVCAIASGQSSDVNVNLIPDECECPADLNGDGLVNAADLALLLGAWGPNPGHPADINGNGAVNASDLALLLGAWGACPT